MVNAVWHGHGQFSILTVAWSWAQPRRRRWNTVRRRWRC